MQLESEKATELKGKGKEGEKADATSVALHPSVFSPYKLGGDKEVRVLDPSCPRYSFEKCSLVKVTRSVSFHLQKAVSGSHYSL